MKWRAGQGIDVHKFGGDKPLILGGVLIPGAQGVLAHSDGDVVLHALCDAILGACALGDIGEHFPDNDERWRGADSRVLLRHCLHLAQQKGYAVANVDITVIAETPRLKTFKQLMRACIAGDLAVDIDAVNVKATTTEGLGAMGRREGIGAQAIVMLQSQT